MRFLEQTCVNGIMSSSARELAENIQSKSVQVRRCAVAITREMRGYVHSSESKTFRSLPFELCFALGTIEKLRRRGGPAFRESTGLADF